MKRKLRSVLIPGAIILTSPTVHSDPGTDNNSPASRSRLLEEVIVTAQKREERLQDVPISVQAYSAEKLDAMGIDDQGGLQRITPGLTVGSQAGFVVTFLRGIGSDAFLTNDPSVVTYVDGVYFPFAYNLGNTFGGVERIEVLKGPQGTLFGRNATGGAINVVTVKPDFEEFYGEIQASYGNYEDTQTRARLNIPLTDWAALNVAAYYNDREQFYEGSAGGRPVPRESGQGVRARFRVAPTDNLDITLSYLNQSSEGAVTQYACNGDPSLLGQVAGVQAQTGFHCDNDAPSYNDLDGVTVTYGHAEYATPWFDLKLIVTDQDIHASGLNDFDGSPQPLAYFQSDKIGVRGESLEFQVLSNPEAGPSWLKWIVGYTEYESVGGFFDLVLGVAGLDLAQGQAAGLTLPTALIDLLSSVVGLPTGGIDAVALVGTESYGVFGQLDISINEWFDVTLGLRHQSEDRYLAKSTSGLRTTNGGVIPLLNGTTAVDGDGNTVPGRSTTNALSPKISFQYRPFADDDLMLFLSYQEATKGATYNAVALYTQPSYVEPEEIEAYELGIKSVWFDGLLQFNGAAFYYDITNLQTQFVALQEGGAISFDNAGGARTYGLDFDFLAVLFPNAVNDLVLSGGAAFIDAVYTEFTGGSGFDEQTGLFSNNNDYTDNVIVRSPDVTATLSLSKTWSAPGGTLETIVDYYYNSGMFFESSNRPASEQKEYDLVGARISYLYEDWGLRATLFGRNLGNELYLQGTLPTDFGPKLSYGDPRVYGAKIQWDF